MYPQNPTLAIKCAYICAFISAAITLVATLLSLGGAFKVDSLDITPLMFSDVILLIGLGIGVFFKSRICAIVLFIYFVFSKYITWKNGTSLEGMLIGLLFLYFYMQGALGSIAYHQRKSSSTIP
jgi:hypothetical protein